MSGYIDSHQHFWQLARGDYDWLTADFGPIFRDFQPGDLSPLLQQAGVDKTIVVQAAPTVAETEYLLELAASTDFIAGVVGWVDMAAADAADIIARLADNPWLKGIRPMIQDIEDVDWMLRPELAPAFSALIQYQLCFDALVKPQHLNNLLTLLKRYPALKVVIDHGAKPDIANQRFDEWATPIAALAEHSQAFCKLSGLLTEAAPGAGADELAPYLQHLLHCFGPSRLLWGSDWPVLNLANNYPNWLAIVESFIEPLSDKEKAQIMGDNCARFYNLETQASLSDTDKRLLRLHADDNILVCCQRIESGENLRIAGQAVSLAETLEVGHKLAFRQIPSGEKIIKYGASIGSAKVDIPFAHHVHLHNIKSDYIPSHIRSGVVDENTETEEKRQ